MFNIGDKIYVPTSFYVDKGIFGGLATVESIEENEQLPKQHMNRFCIYVEEHPKHSYNSILIINNQEKWKKEYGGRIAYFNGNRGVG